MRIFGPTLGMVALSWQLLWSGGNVLDENNAALNGKGEGGRRKGSAVLL